MQKKRTQLASSIRSLAFLKSIRLTEQDARGLMATFHEVFTHPENYDRLVSAWQRFIDTQEMIAGQLKYRNWEKLDGKTLRSLAQGRFALQDAIRNFLPNSLWVSDNDRRGLFMRQLLLKAFMEDDAELLRTCALCWQAIRFVAAEMTRHAKKNEAAFLRAVNLYFTTSEDKDMHGADLMRGATAKELAKLAWRRLPARVKSELYLGQRGAAGLRNTHP